MASKIKVALASDVREWAKNDGRTVGKRGLFADALVKDFNDAHKGQMRYEKGRNSKTVPLKVRVTSASGKTRTETREFTVAEIRTAAAKTLDNVPSRGPLSEAVREAAAANLAVTPEA